MVPVNDTLAENGGGASLNCSETSSRRMNKAEYCAPTIVRSERSFIRAHQSINLFTERSPLQQSEGPVSRANAACVPDQNRTQVPEVKSRMAFRRANCRDAS
jgi:hypothetical protein